MALEQYKVKNGWRATLKFAIDEDDLIAILDWAYESICDSWATKTVAKITEKDIDGNIIARENILITNRTGDQITFTRAFESVLIDDDATTLLSQALPFSAGATVEVIFSQAMFDNIMEELSTNIPNAAKLKFNNCTVVTKSADYTFTGSEANNTWFSTDTTSGDVTYDLDLSLFPTTNGLFEFTFCNTTGVNNVIIDVWSWSVIDSAQTYTLTEVMETVTIRIVNGTFAKVVSTSNKPVVAPMDINGLTEKTTIDDDDADPIYDSVWLGNKKRKFSTLRNKLIDGWADFQTTKNLADTTWATTVFAHWLWRTPRRIEIHWFLSTSRMYASDGSWKTGNIEQCDVSFSTSSGQQRNDRSIIASNSTSASTSQQGNITVDSTNVTITWTKFGSPTWTFFIHWKVF